MTQQNYRKEKDGKTLVIRTWFPNEVSIKPKQQIAGRSVVKGNRLMFTGIGIQYPITVLKVGDGIIGVSDKGIESFFNYEELNFIDEK